MIELFHYKRHSYLFIYDKDTGIRDIYKVNYRIGCMGCEIATKEKLDLICNRIHSIPYLSSNRFGLDDRIEISLYMSRVIVRCKDY